MLTLILYFILICYLKTPLCAMEHPDSDDLCIETIQLIRAL